MIPGVVPQMKNSEVTFMTKLSQNGHIEIPQGKLSYRVFQNSENANKTPILFIHGGPGVPLYGMENDYQNIASERPVIFYDQLGCGESPINSEFKSDDSLWQLERFVEELAIIREALNLKEVHLLGISFGTMILAEYILTHPKGVKSIIFSSPVLSSKLWAEDAERLKKKLPETIYQTIIKHESENTTDSEEYQEATNEYYKRFLCKTFNFKEILEKFTQNPNFDLYLKMWGPSEFHPTGTLKDYDITERLSEINTPTLFICGRDDEATPETVKLYQSKIPGAEITVLENSAHFTCLDAKEEYYQSIADFISRHE